MALVRRAPKNADGSVSTGNSWVIVYTEDKGLNRNWKAFAGYVNGKPTSTDKVSGLQVFRKWKDAFPIAKKLQALNFDVDIRRIGFSGEDSFYFLSPKG